MKSINSTEREMKRLQLEILRKQNTLAELDITKREAEILLIRQQIISAKSTRMIMRVTATLTGISIIATIMNYFGVFSNKV
ncbi:hypothetical protein [Alteromonas macleodii]|uniref:Hemolysin XhlA n=1 Tax=Alteromonas macleodii TaxID=28108 RepID=A0AB36FNP3_ALTMA|nr:hypothetical protein [Alteromonas macleodii]OES24677.1 hypothetical protein BFV93_4694 [Alteromonas macleodii]OES25780.1 hypothetical protein BFV94_4306 [Alteromonas macleodii]OES25863.1 hypothetical protein BFV95_4251 [Alteromonas macleodii]OES38962.1 hypothetical protein BFV96_4456 [Alteromonas macleodii]